MNARIIPLLFLAILGAIARVTPARAQTAEDLVRRGIAAHRALEFDEASRLLRRGISARGPSALTASARAEAWIYLGATEIFRGRPDDAASAFRESLLIEPRIRPDTLDFPPQVTEAFDATRRRTFVTKIRAASDTTVSIGADTFEVRLYASMEHAVEADLIAGEGRQVRRLFIGPVRDSIDLGWDGLDATGRPVSDTNDLLLRVTSRSPAGEVRTLELPLMVHAIGADTVVPPPRPADSLLLPERDPPRIALTGVLAGLGAGAVAAVLPAMVAEDGSGSSARFVVGGALGVAALVALLSQRGDRPIDANIIANRERLESWRREVAAARAENERIRRDIRLRITTGPPRTGGAR